MSQQNVAQSASKSLQPSAADSLRNHPAGSLAPQFQTQPHQSFGNHRLSSALPTQNAMAGSQVMRLEDAFAAATQPNQTTLAQSLRNHAPGWLKQGLQGMQQWLGTAHEAAVSPLPQSQGPLIGIIDTGFAPGQHGNQMLKTIQSGNPEATILLAGGVGKGTWADSLTQFVDTAKATGQTRAVVNASFDLTQKNPDGSITTRQELTAQEKAALNYARENGVLVVASAGNEGKAMSALGQASGLSDNLIVVGSAEGNDRAAYSSYGSGLDLVTKVSSAGTSLAAAKVTGAIANIWSANPELSSQQVNQVLTATATDLKAPGWDAETGAGLLNSTGAVGLAKTITPKTQIFSGSQLMQQVNKSSENSTWRSTNGSVASERTAGLTPNIALVKPNIDAMREAVNLEPKPPNPPDELTALAPANERPNLDVFGGIAATARKLANSPGLAAIEQPNPTPGQVAIQQGDTLWDVAQKQLGSGDRWRELRKSDGSPFTEQEASHVQAGTSVQIPGTRPDPIGTPTQPPPDPAAPPAPPPPDPASNPIADVFSDFVSDATSNVSAGLSDAGNFLSDVVDNGVNWIEENGSTVVSEVGHTILDVAGLAPAGFGAVPDLINAGWYLVEGREADAAASVFGALPIAGDTTTAIRLAARAGRYGGDIIKNVADNVSDLLFSEITDSSLQAAPSQMDERESFEAYPDVEQSTSWEIPFIRPADDPNTDKITTAESGVGVGLASQGGYEVVYLQGQLFEQIKTDPDMIEHERAIIEKIQADPRYGRESFHITDKELVGFGGERWTSPEENWFIPDENNPLLHSETYPAIANELTWVLRNATAKYWAEVTPQGEINIEYRLNDRLDLSPTEGRSLEYNTVSAGGSFIYHDLFGGNRNLQTRAEWNTTVDANLGSADLSNSDGDLNQRDHSSELAPEPQSGGSGNSNLPPQDPPIGGGDSPSASDSEPNDPNQFSVPENTNGTLRPDQLNDRQMTVDDLQQRYPDLGWTKDHISLIEEGRINPQSVDFLLSKGIPLDDISLFASLYKSDGVELAKSLLEYRRSREEVIDLIEQSNNGKNNLDVLSQRFREYVGEQKPFSLGEPKDPKNMHEIVQAIDFGRRRGGTFEFDEKGAPGIDGFHRDSFDPNEPSVPVSLKVFVKPNAKTVDDHAKAILDSVNKNVKQVRTAKVNGKEIGNGNAELFAYVKLSKRDLENHLENTATSLSERSYAETFNRVTFICENGEELVLNQDKLGDLLKKANP